MSASGLNFYRLPGLPVICCEYPALAGDVLGTRTKLATLAEHHVGVIVDLTTREDQLERYDPGAHGLVVGQQVAAGVPWQPVVWTRPIPDAGTPGTVSEFARIVAEIGERLEAAPTPGSHWVAIHCWGGVGRTALVAAGLLVRYGWPVGEALAAVNDGWRATSKAVMKRHAERTAPEAESQRAMVREFAGLPRSVPRTPTITGLSAHVTRGCLLGGAVGDALGAPVEFLTWSAIQARHGPEGISEFDVKDGVRGQITDDTQMTLFTAEGLLRAMTRGVERGVCHPPGIVRLAYLRWMKTQGERVKVAEALDVSGGGGILLSEKALHARRAPGNTCLGALQSGAPTWPDSLRARNTSKGCGTVMRVAPVGLFREPDEAFTLGLEVSWLTHGHPVGTIAGGAFAMLIAYVARGMSLRDAVERVAGFVEGTSYDVLEVEHRAAHASAGREVAWAMHAGVAVGQEAGRELSAAHVERLCGRHWGVAEDALAIALACAVASEGDFAVAVRMAANHSNDSDSTASMTGQLVGALGGVGAVPQRWRVEVELGGLVASVADDLALGWSRGAWWERRWPGW